MKAVVKAKPGVGLELWDREMPKIEPDEMLVKVLAAGICGSDRDIYNWRASKQGIPLPMTIGHELFGEVVELGSQVQGFEVGDRISSDSHMPCGTCYLCRTGKPHLCMKRGVLGNQKNGCFAEYLALPAVAAVKMPKDTKPEFGALMEPMGVVYHAASVTPLSGKSREEPRSQPRHHLLDQRREDKTGSRRERRLRSQQQDRGRCREVHGVHQRPRRGRGL